MRTWVGRGLQVRSAVRDRLVERASRRAVAPVLAAVIAGAAAVGGIELEGRGSPDRGAPVTGQDELALRPATPEMVADMAFELFAIEQGGVDLELTEPPPRLEFGREWLAVITRCNDSIAPFETSGGRLRHLLDGTTMKGCVGVVGGQERAIYTALFDVTMPPEARVPPSISIAGTTVEVRQRDLVIRGVADGAPQFDEDRLAPSTYEGPTPWGSSPG